MLKKILILTLLTSSIIFSQDIRDAKWGYTIEKVISLESKKYTDRDKIDDEDGKFVFLKYESRLCNCDAPFTYVFKKMTKSTFGLKKDDYYLVGGYYRIDEKDPDDIEKTFDYLVALLKPKYGDDYEILKENKNKCYIWITKRSKISLTLIKPTKRSSGTVALEYTDKTLIDEKL